MFSVFDLGEFEKLNSKLLGLTAVRGEFLSKKWFFAFTKVNV